MVDIIGFLTTCINNSPNCRTNLGFVTPGQTGQLHGQVYITYKYYPILLTCLLMS